ncbi:MAG TPA: hypothetical protein ENJ10_06325 [Caldithrix abyssi]|uniref:Uncharacterized protein n=1 Tax=Caldithrix abyssi TaxID=187145 RepID=A0A7V1LLP5_CALAY|nr:hypothetical protein [Caldithrix abyssi]
MKRKLSAGKISAVIIFLIGLLLAIGYPGKDVMLQRVQEEARREMLRNQNKSKRAIPLKTSPRKKKKIIYTPPPVSAGAEDEGC